MLKVYGFLASINVRKVVWAAAEAGLPIEREEWGGAGRSLADPEFAKLSQFGVVPVIDHDGLIMRRVQHHLAVSCSGARPHGSTAGGPRDRAAVETWMDWQATDLNSSWRPAFHALMRGHKATPEAIAASEAAWTKNMGASMRIFQHPDMSRVTTSLSPTSASGLRCTAGSIRPWRIPNFRTAAAIMISFARARRSSPTGNLAGRSRDNFWRGWMAVNIRPSPATHSRALEARDHRAEVGVRHAGKVPRPRAGEKTGEGQGKIGSCWKRRIFPHVFPLTLLDEPAVQSRSPEVLGVIKLFW